MSLYHSSHRLRIPFRAGNALLKDKNGANAVLVSWNATQGTQVSHKSPNRKKKESVMCSEPEKRKIHVRHNAEPSNEKTPEQRNKERKLDVRRKANKRLLVLRGGIRICRP